MISPHHIVSELHAHTVASDGRMSIEQLVAAARDRGMHTIAVTDHSQSSPEADGLSPARLREHIKAVREVGSSFDGITVLAGAEVDILADGQLDYDDELLAELDIVVASIHHHFDQSPAKATQRLVRAASHPLVHIIGHPTGRFGSDVGLDPDMHELVAAAAEHDTALEINCNPKRMDLSPVDAELAMQAGALLAINCDVHAAKNFDRLQYGLATASSACVEPERCINTWDAQTLMQWLATRVAK